MLVPLLPDISVRVGFCLRLVFFYDLFRGI